MSLISFGTLNKIVKGGLYGVPFTVMLGGRNINAVMTALRYHPGETET